LFRPSWCSLDAWVLLWLASLPHSASALWLYSHPSEWLPPRQVLGYDSGNELGSLLGVVGVIVEDLRSPWHLRCKVYTINHACRAHVQEFLIIQVYPSAQRPRRVIHVIPIAPAVPQQHFLTGAEVVAPQHGLRHQH